MFRSVALIKHGRNTMTVYWHCVYELSICTDNMALILCFCWTYFCFCTSLPFLFQWSALISNTIVEHNSCLRGRSVFVCLFVCVWLCECATSRDRTRPMASTLPVHNPHPPTPPLPGHSCNATFQTVVSMNTHHRNVTRYFCPLLECGDNLEPVEASCHQISQ